MHTLDNAPCGSSRGTSRPLVLLAFPQSGGAQSRSHGRPRVLLKMHPALGPQVHHNTFSLRSPLAHLTSRLSPIFLLFPLLEYLLPILTTPSQMLAQDFSNGRMLTTNIIRSSSTHSPAPTMPRPSLLHPPTTTSAPSSAPTPPMVPNNNNERVEMGPNDG